MSTTLTNGLKLPDKGSVDWYADMQNNYSILDGAVGTIAEHTTALSGKAPLVHTHTKSDVTDLFNSANEWTGNNTFPLGLYQKGFSPRASAPASNEFGQLSITDTNNSAVISINYANRTTGARDLSFRVFDGTGNVNGVGVFKDAINNYSFCCIDPNNTISLGNSALQWKSVYAQSYYYNGVAWGLDKANKWSNYNSYSKGIELAGSRYAYILPEFAANYSGISLLTNSFGKSVKFGSYTVDENSVVSLDTTLGFIEISAGIANNVNSARIQPKNTVVAELGTSSNQWKTLNGINPGALGLPSGNYDPIDTNGWDLTGATGQSYTPTVNGWLFISIQNIAGNYFSIVSGRGAISIDGTGAQNGLRAMLPVIANESVVITVKTGAMFAARFYPMQGNVS